MIYTTYFAQLKNLPQNIIPISICLKAPEWYSGLQYKKLAPKYGFFAEWKKTHDNEYYIQHFHEEVLAGLNVFCVLKELQSLLPAEIQKLLDVPVYKSDKVHIALVCYENPADFCHRHLVADWFHNHGVPCREWARFRVIIAGSRSFNDYAYLKESMDHLLRNIPTEIVVVCGKARGADALGEQYAMKRGYAVHYFPADWDKYGKAAGYIRNEKMARNADALVAFWDDKSPGTKNMIDLARRYGLLIRVKKEKR